MVQKRSIQAAFNAKQDIKATAVVIPRTKEQKGVPNPGEVPLRANLKRQPRGDQQWRE